MYVDGANDPQTEVSLSQPLNISNFGKRDKVAELIRKAGDTERGIKLLEFSQQNTVNYVRLYSLQETVRVLIQAEADAAHQVATVSKQVKEGLLSQGSEAVFQGEKARIEAQRVGTEGNLAALQSELSMTIGTTCKVIAVTAPSFSKIAPSSSLIDKARSSGISEQTRLQVLQALAIEQTRLAELDAFPIFAPRVVYQHTNDGGDFIGAGLTLPLPLWNRNQPEITRATAEQEVSRRKTDLVTKGGLELQVATSHAAAVSAHRQVEIYASRVAPSFRAALTSEERAYQSGKGSILEVWQTFRAWNEAQVTGLALWQHAAMARARLSILVGEEV
jgi:outer membrane protein TolC